MISNVLLNDDFDFTRSLKSMVLYADQVDILLPTQEETVELMVQSLSKWINEGTENASLFDPAAMASARSRFERLRQRLIEIEKLREDIDLASKSGIVNLLGDQYLDSFRMQRAQSEEESSDFVGHFLGSELQKLTTELPVMVERFPGLMLYPAFHDLGQASDLFSLFFELLMSHNSSKQLSTSAYEEAFGAGAEDGSNAQQVAKRLSEGKFFQSLALATLASVATKRSASVCSTSPRSTYMFETAMRIRLPNGSDNDDRKVLDQTEKIAATFIEAALPSVGCVPIDTLLRLRERRRDELERFKLEVIRVRSKLNYEEGKDDLQKLTKKYFENEIKPALSDLKKSLKDMKANDASELLRPDLVSVSGTVLLACSILGFPPTVASPLTVPAVLTAAATRIYNLTVKLPREMNGKVRQSPYALLYRLEQLKRP